MRSGVRVMLPDLLRKSHYHNEPEEDIDSLIEDGIIEWLTMKEEVEDQIDPPGSTESLLML
jgi:hypothetical protein